MAAVAADEGKSSEVADAVGDSSTEELIEREALVVGLAFVVEVAINRVEPRIVSIVAGPEAKEKSMDGVEQHAELSKP